MQAAQNAVDAKVEAENASKRYFNAQIAEVEAEELLNAIAGIVPIAKELVKDTSVGVVAQSFKDAENAIKQVKIASVKVEDVFEQTQKVVDNAKVHMKELTFN